MAELVKDPVCGMEIDPETAAGKSEHQGVTYYFCAEGCKQSFDTNPQQYLGGGEATESEAPAAAPAATAPAEAAPAEAATAGAPTKRWWEFWKS